MYVCSVENVSLYVRIHIRTHICIRTYTENKVYSCVLFLPIYIQNTCIHTYTRETAYIHIYIHTHLHTCIHMSQCSFDNDKIIPGGLPAVKGTFVCYVCLCICVFMCVCVCMYVCIYAYIFVSVCVCVCLYIYIYIYIYIYHW